MVPHSIYGRAAAGDHGVLDAITATSRNPGSVFVSSGARLGRGDNAIVISLLILGLSFVLPKISVVASMAITVYLILRADPQSLPAVYLLQLSASDFRLAGFRSFEYHLSRFEELTVFVAGFPVTPNYMLLASAAIRVVYEVVARPATYRVTGSLWFLCIWLVSLVPALASTIAAFDAKTQAWTSPIRLAMLTSCFLYGQILWGNRSRDTELYLVARFLSIWCVLYALSSLDLCWQRTLFVFLGFVPGMVAVAWKSRRHGLRLLGLATLISAAVYALGLTGMSAVKSDVHGGVATTTTLVFMFTVGSLMALAVWKTPRVYRPVGSVLAGALAAVLIVAVPVFVGLTYEDRRTGRDWQDQDLTLVDRTFYKLFDDRGPLWQGALEDISIPPYIVREYNRPFYAKFHRHGVKRVPFGSHNTVLEEIRLNGFFTGGFGVVAIMLGLMVGFLARTVPSGGFMHAWAGGVVTAGTVAVTASSFMTDVVNGFWFFAGAGMASYWWAINRRKVGSVATGVSVASRRPLSSQATLLQPT